MEHVRALLVEQCHQNIIYLKRVLPINLHCDASGKNASLISRAAVLSMFFIFAEKNKKPVPLPVCFFYYRQSLK